MKFNPCSGNILIRYNVQVDDYQHGGVLGADGNVYARSRYGQIYKIDTSNMEFKIIGHNICWKTGAGWGLPVLGADKQIYFPPCNHNQVLQYNSSMQNRLLIGNSYEQDSDKWYGGALAPDGYVYFFPYNSKNILQVDTRPLNEKIMELIKKIHQEHEHEHLNQA